MATIVDYVRNAPQQAEFLRTAFTKFLLLAEWCFTGDDKTPIKWESGDGSEWELTKCNSEGKYRLVVGYLPPDDVIGLTHEHIYILFPSINGVKYRHIATRFVCYESDRTVNYQDNWWRTNRPQKYKSFKFTNS